MSAARTAASVEADVLRVLSRWTRIDQSDLMDHVGLTSSDAEFDALLDGMVERGVIHVDDFGYVSLPPAPAPGAFITPDFIANLLAEYLENQAVEELSRGANAAALDAALDEHGVSVSAHDDGGTFRLDFAGKRFIVRVMEAL